MKKEDPTTPPHPTHTHAHYIVFVITQLSQNLNSKLLFNRSFSERSSINMATHKHKF